MLAHCLALIDAAGPACVAAKPQLACFERLGFPGWLALEATVAYARDQGLLVIADAKRGDFPGSARAYEQAVFSGTETPYGPTPSLGADAVTQNPLLGRDALAPFVDGARRGRRRRVRARAHLEPRRRRPVRRRARRAAARCGSGSRSSSTRPARRRRIRA